MLRLEVSGAVRPLYGSLGVKGLKQYAAYSHPYTTQYTSSQHISLRSILILFSNVFLGLTGGPILSGFPVSNLYAHLLYPYVPHVPPISSSIMYPNIRSKIIIMKLLIMYFSPVLFLPPRQKISHNALSSNILHLICF